MISPAKRGSTPLDSQNGEQVNYPILKGIGFTTIRLNKMYGKMHDCYIQALWKNTIDFRLKGVTEQLLLS